MQIPLLAALVLAGGIQPAQAPEAAFAAMAKTYLSPSLTTGWDGLEQLPGFTWTSAVTELRNCLPNGDCYARQGRATIGSRNFVVVASGARTIVMNLLARNTSAPLGAPAIVAALGQSGFTVELARCPIRADAAGTSWYRLKGADGAPGMMSIQPAGAGRTGDGYILTRSADLPTLPPNQLAAYTEQCAAGAERRPVATLRPHESVAQAFVALLAPAAGAPSYDWAALLALPTGIHWLGDTPRKADLSFKGDPNPVSLTGEVSYAGRKFSAMASGTPTQVKVIYLEELGRHARGEHMLGEVYKQGIAVALVRCGPVYTESTNNWYSLSSPRTRPASIRQSINYDGNQVAESYELRLDGTLPTRDPRDRNPGVADCR